MKALQRINHSIWEITEELKRNPENRDARRELLEYFLSSRLYLERKNNVPVEERSFMLIQKNPAHCVMLIHGVGGSPLEMKEMAEHLFKEGYTVCAMRLPIRVDRETGKLIDYVKKSFRRRPDFGGSKRRSTNRNTWGACLSESEIALETFMQYSPDTTVVGFSFGGLIALNLQKKYGLLKTVLIAPAIYPREKGNLNFRLILKVAPGLARRSDSVRFTIADFIQKTRAWIDNIENPVMLIQSVDDPVVSLRGYDFLKRRCSNPKSEYLLFETGGHVLVKGEKAQEAFSSIAKFIKKV